MPGRGVGRAGSTRAGPGRPGSTRLSRAKTCGSPFSRHTELGHPAGMPQLPWAGANVVCNRSGQRGGVAENGVGGVRREASSLVLCALSFVTVTNVVHALCC